MSRASDILEVLGSDKFKVKAKSDLAFKSGKVKKGDIFNGYTSKGKSYIELSGETISFEKGEDTEFEVIKDK